MTSVIERRTFMALLSGGLLTVPLVGEAQQAGKVYRVGILGDKASDSDETHTWQIFRAALRERGWNEGVNIRIEYRWAEGNAARLPELAADLVRLKPDLIVARGSFCTGALKAATSSIPIVFLGHADPVGTGHVTSLSRPGGNITGLSVMMTEISVKSLELFKQAVPGLARVAVIWDPATPSHTPALKAVEAAGPFLKLQVHPVAVRSATEYDSAFLAIVRERADAVLVLTTPLFIAGAQRLAELSLTHKLPSVFG